MKKDKKKKGEGRKNRRKINGITLQMHTSSLLPDLKKSLLLRKVHKTL